MGRRFCVLFPVLAVLIVLIAPNAYSKTHARAHSRPARHRVKKGDTLYSLARTNGLSVAELKRANRLRGDKLNAGSVLKIPSGHSHGARYARRAVAVDRPSEQARKPEEDGSVPQRGNALNAGQELRIPDGGLPEVDAGRVPEMAPEKADVTTAEAAPETSNVTARETPSEAGKTPSGTAGAQDDAFSDEALTDIERRYEGVPYRFGGSGFNGIDCSGFTRSVFGSMGLSLPRSAREQFLVGIPVEKSELKRGDLVFFSTYAKYPSHVGIYVGDGRFMHMSTSKGTVEITGLNDNYYASSYLGARRVLHGE